MQWGGNSRLPMFPTQDYAISSRPLGQPVAIFPVVFRGKGKVGDDRVDCHWMCGFGSPRPSGLSGLWLLAHREPWPLVQLCAGPVTHLYHGTHPPTH